MSVVVLGMDYPESCCDCDFCYVYIGCRRTGDSFFQDSLVESEFDISTEKLPNCPLRPLPAKHSRLIDADVLELGMQELWKANEISNEDWLWFREELNNQETIVEAEGE